MGRRSVRIRAGGGKVSHAAVRPGLEVLASEQASLVRGRRVGLLTHPAAIDRGYRPAAAVLGAEAGAEVVRLFAPEHGVTGGFQDMVEVDERTDPVTGLPVVSLYGADESSLAPRPEQLDGLDLLVVDLVDVGARYYTFAASAVRSLPVAGSCGVPVIVCDRPNPIGGVLVEGEPVREGYHSFVGELPVPPRHGLTLGELCRFAVLERGIDVDLTVVPAEGWRREMWWDRTGLPFVPPSPNMPSVETATVYPGSCLVEGTNLSEGRGTTRPFETIGAPWLDPRRLAERLESFALPGVRFRPIAFVPSFHKHAGRVCGGVFVHVTDRERFRPVLTGVALLAAARAEDPERFAWRMEPYEFVADIPAIDLLGGGPSLREALEAGADPRDIASGWAPAEREFRERRLAVTLY
ncbi:MAG: DUF1343 domain-containing protein [Acidobacteria bacterium]|nr:MAG: DUF1343 domain-containing protein [Acidobacteriota bacterium]